MATRDTFFRGGTGNKLFASSYNRNFIDIEEIGKATDGLRVIDGFKVEEASGLFIDIGAGRAAIGRYIDAPATSGLAVPASETRWVWLKASTVYSVVGGVVQDDAATFELTAAEASPTGDGILLAEVTTDGSGVTSVVDMRDIANQWTDRETYSIGGGIAVADTNESRLRAPNLAYDSDAYSPADALESFPLRTCGGVTNLSMLTSGRLALCLRYVAKTITTADITFWSGSTAAGTPTNQWFAIYDDALGLIAQTANDTTTAWSANTAKTLTIGSPPTLTPGYYYFGIMVTATTVPTIRGVTLALGAFSALPPIRFGESTTGLTTTAPSTAAALNAREFLPYFLVEAA